LADKDSLSEPRTERLPLNAQQTLTLRVWDGSDRPVGAGRRITFVYLNGLESHSLWASTFATVLSEQGHRFVGLDRRRSGSNRDLGGSARDWLDDVVRVCEAERQSNGGRELYLIGQCFGARVAIGAALRRPDLADRLILFSVGLEMRVDVTLGEKVLIGIGQALKVRIRIPSPIGDDRLLTRDPEALEYIANDPLRMRDVDARDFYAGHILRRRIRRPSQSVPVPCLALFAEDDPIVNVPRTIELLRGLFGDRLTVRTFSKADHLLLFGRAGQQALETVLREIA
jgi:alpha-beta hydrolase superfamily lysophospholipase